MYNAARNGLGWILFLCIGWHSLPVQAAPSRPFVRPAPEQTQLDALRKRTLVIATKLSPPFSMKNKEGKWEGISIALWEHIAKKLKLKYTFQEATLSDMLKQTAQGKIDVAVASLTITPERESVLDFTHPFYSTGLGIAVNHDQQSTKKSVMGTLFTWKYMRLFVVLMGLLIFSGILVWWFEHKANPDEFGGHISHGIGAGVWWSVVTMTTVGYGDKSPRTFFGRILAIIWIFAGLILVSSFTATLTAIHTVSQLESKIKGPKDLYRMRVATVKQSTSSRYLKRKLIPARRYDNISKAIKAVVTKQADAIVYDAPLLQYLGHHQFDGMLKVLKPTFERQDYGIALPEQSPLREPINRELLQFIQSRQWRTLLKRYLGQ